MPLKALVLGDDGKAGLARLQDAGRSQAQSPGMASETSLRRPFPKDSYYHTLRHPHPARGTQPWSISVFSFPSPPTPHSFQDRGFSLQPPSGRGSQDGSERVAGLLRHPKLLLVLITLTSWN